MLLTFAIWRIIITGMHESDSRNNFGRILRQQRVTVPLTLQELSSMSGVSPSHLGRIERGERFPSASILRKVAKPLGFEEDELFTLAGYLSSHSSGIAEEHAEYRGGGGDGAYLDPYVGRMLAQEPVEVQRAVIGVLTILKSISKSLPREG